MTTTGFDAELSSVRAHVDGLGVWLRIWQARAEPDADARRCARDAIVALDAALLDLHQIRAALIGEIRAADDAAAARADALLRDRPP